MDEKRKNNHEMQRLIRWLRSVEMLASHIYTEASDRLRHDQLFSSFLQRLSDDESWHYHLLGEAARHLAEIGKNLQPVVQLDDELKKDVELPFQQLDEIITRKPVNRRDVLACIVSAEFSEWNGIFVYVINALREYSPKFQHAAAAIESHKDRILEFLADFSQEMNVSMSVWNLPKIWDRKILIVDEEPATRDFLTHILENFGEVEYAADGSAGLAKISDGFYNVIVSDAHMQKMSGMELFHKAVDNHPRIGRHFVFTSSQVTPELTEFFQKNNLPYLVKPFSIRKLTHVVQDMIEKTL